MAQVMRSAPQHDVVVIGSGAGGGTVTKGLAGLGINVTLLEARPTLNPTHDYKEHMWPYQVPHRGAGEKGEIYFGKNPYPFGYFAAPAGGWELAGGAHTGAPGGQVLWFRSRTVGGRTNHYGRFSFRFADYDFKPNSRDGLGMDWPITYDDVAPY